MKIRDADVHLGPSAFGVHHYSLALGHLEDYCGRLTNGKYYAGSERGYVTETDLVRWTFELALTCAAYMVPQSLGMAKLFRVSQILADSQNRQTQVRVYASEFTGAFSVNQLIDVFDNTRLRNLRFVPDSRTSLPAALQCVGVGIPIIQSLKHSQAMFDESVRVLGATHILAIPLVAKLSDLNWVNQPVSITVDLRFGRLAGWLIDNRNIQKASVFRRATNLSSILMAVEQLPRLAEWHAR